jgi:hypothetical protein
LVSGPPLEDSFLVFCSADWQAQRLLITTQDVGRIAAMRKQKVKKKIKGGWVKHKAIQITCGEYTGSQLDAPRSSSAHPETIGKSSALT